MNLQKFLFIYLSYIFIYMPAFSSLFDFLLYSIVLELYCRVCVNIICVVWLITGTFNTEVKVLIFVDG